MMTIEGDTANNVAPGIAYKEITVKPPASQLDLKVSIGNRDLGYLSHYKDGFLVTDKNRINVTLTEARDIGLTFDASQSRGGTQTEQVQEAGETYIQAISWDFGDGSDEIMGEMVAADVQTHYYEEEGAYPVIIEVTDSRGIRDRKVFEVVVNTIAARIDLQPTSKAQINETITYDAGQSLSDGGQIVGYDWEITNSALHYSAEHDTESFTETYESPGIYNVSLTVTDNIGDSATDTISLFVESKPPEAQFDYSVPDANKPHIYMLDGTKSFDPDGDIQSGGYTYKWYITATSNDYDFVDENGDRDEEGNTKSRTYLKFFRTGDYDVKLEIDDVNEPENPGIPHEQTIHVDSILDVNFGDSDVTATILDDDGEADITLTVVSENGIAYEWDFGDDSSKATGDLVIGEAQSTHTYTQAGTYDVRLTVFDKDDNENTINRRVTIGEADNPLAVISIKVNGEEYFDLSEAVQVNRKSVIEFDASPSLNRDGTGRRLGYQWDFGDTQKSTQKTITHTYSDLSPTTGYYTVTLKVLDKNDLTKISTSSINIDVIGELPTMQAFIAVPQQTDLTTPVKVKLEAIGAKDPDGQIVKYLWWYYDQRDPSLTMGHTITQESIAHMTIGTIGLQDEQKTYMFGLQMTDQENFTIQASDILSSNMIPSVGVINGPNDIPVARFNVDRTSIMVNETINFTSSSYDPDGKIVQYVWDFEGDGFGNNKATNLSTISHTYETPAIDGINVRLKVIDDNFAESVSPPLKIYIDTDAEAPVAAFKTEQTDDKTIQFINNSTSDEEAGAQLVKYIWDFDVSSALDTADSDGDGTKDNDTDSTEEEPEFEYLEDGIYRAKLTVEDNLGNRSEVVNFVNVKPSEEEEVRPAAAELKADFTTNPVVRSDDNSVHLYGDFSEVRFDFSDSQGNIVKYVFDNNVYVDANNNGRKADDEDYIATSPGVYTTTFNAETERIKVRLTVYDDEGNMDIKEVRVVFDETQGMEANLLGGIHKDTIPAIVVSLVLFAIVSLSLYMHSVRFETERVNTKRNAKGKK
jgi:PKD repeat protein